MHVALKSLGEEEYNGGRDGSQESLLSAVAGALQHAEVDAPGADGLAILVGHDARDLMEVGEIVDGPGGEEL